MPFHFWFLFDMIMTNFIFIFIITLFRKNYLYYFEFLSIITYFFQYSGTNYKLWKFVKKSFSLARISEFIPLAITGFILREYNILYILQKYKLNTSIISLVIFIFIENYEVFLNFVGGLYHGIKLNVLSLCIIFLFSLFSLERNTNNYLLNFIRILTNFTGGIFYLHQMVHNYLMHIIIAIKKGTFQSLFLIYFFSYITCFLGTKIFWRTRVKYLFS